jgi:hypothetical protein
MPDTKIAKVIDNNKQYWIDVDQPTQFWTVRRLARDARRSNLVQQGKVKPVVKQNYTPKNPHVITTNLTAVGTITGNVHVLSQLQQKLFNRLTTQQNVSVDDAFRVITTYGYNKAASYGHMREAGATDPEADIVVNLNNPAISLCYGIGRASGLNHTLALGKALKDNDD